MRSWPHVAACVLMLHADAASGQSPALIVTDVRSISTDAARVPHVESFIAINPRNPANMIASAITVDDGAARSSVYATQDGGKTWQRARSAVPRGTPNVFNGSDPAVYFDSEGVGYFATIQAAPIGFLVSRSTDGGLTWQQPITVPGGTYDRQYLAFDNSGGRFHGRLYAAGTINVQEVGGRRHDAIAVTYSTDGGRTFSQPALLDAGDSEEIILIIADMLVTEDGTLVVPFRTLDRVQPTDSMVKGRLWTVLSKDGGQSFESARPGPPIVSGSGYRERRTNSAPRAAIDRSSRYRDRIYLVWVDFDGRQYRVKLAYLQGLYATWSVPTAVNDSDGTDDPANPAVSVNDHGIVAVSFNDRRDDSGNECYRFYVATSADGGTTFHRNVQAHSGATCPNSPGNWTPNVYSFLSMPLDLSRDQRWRTIAFAGVPYRWPNGGDTQGLAAAPDGSFRAAWINGESGVMQLWYAEVQPHDHVIDEQRRSAVRDVSESVALEVSKSAFDVEGRRVRLTVRLRNTTTAAIPGPLSVVVHDFRSMLQRMRVANADNGLSGNGALWRFSDHADLMAGEATETREFVWEFDGGLPAEPGEPLRARFTVMGHASNSRP